MSKHQGLHFTPVFGGQIRQGVDVVDVLTPILAGLFQFLTAGFAAKGAQAIPGRIQPAWLGCRDQMIDKSARFKVVVVILLGVDNRAQEQFRQTLRQADVDLSQAFGKRTHEPQKLAPVIRTHSRVQVFDPRRDGLSEDLRFQRGPIDVRGLWVVRGRHCAFVVFLFRRSQHPSDTTRRTVGIEPVPVGRDLGRISPPQRGQSPHEQPPIGKRRAAGNIAELLPGQRLVSRVKSGQRTTHGQHPGMQVTLLRAEFVRMQHSLIGGADRELPACLGGVDARGQSRGFLAQAQRRQHQSQVGQNGLIGDAKIERVLGNLCRASFPHPFAEKLLGSAKIGAFDECPMRWVTLLRGETDFFAKFPSRLLKRRAVSNCSTCAAGERGIPAGLRSTRAVATFSRHIPAAPSAPGKFTVGKSRIGRFIWRFQELWDSGR